MKFRNLKILLISILFVNLSFFVNAKPVPGSFADLAEKLTPSVVYISTTQTVVTNVNPFPFEFPPGSPFEDMFKEFGTPQTRKASALGSGFIIDSKGIVITNNHVIKGAENILVRVEGDKEYKAKVLGADPLSDIAVLKIESKEKLIPVKFGDSDKARIGDWVIAIGNPFGLGGTVTSGIISARNRDIGMSRYEDFIQTDASINVGNSGGPLFDMNGDVIGINTAIRSSTGEFTGVGFAVPSNTIKKIVPSLIEEGKYHHPWMGITGIDIDPDLAKIRELGSAKGFLVVTVIDGHPADDAGLQGVSKTVEIDGKEYPIDGDIIVSVDGKEVRKINDLLVHLQREKSVGDEMILGVMRGGDLIHLTLTLGERPD